MAMTAPTLPTEYLTELDSILTHESYSARYAVQGAEFVNAKQVSVPEITFDGGTNRYDRFKTENSGALSYTTYTLDHDQEAVFYVDAVEDADAQSILSTQTAAEFERQKLIPEVDTGFFAKAVKSAGGTGTDAITADNVKQVIRKARSQFVKVGLAGGDLYLTSDALGALEDATKREWGNDGSITDSVGTYDGFTVYEVADDVLGTDLLAISGGTNTIRHITKRAVAYHFAPGQHTQGDGYLDQYRWVYGDIVRKNKMVGIYSNKHSA